MYYVRVFQIDDYVFQSGFNFENLEGQGCYQTVLPNFDLQSWDCFGKRPVALKPPNVCRDTKGIAMEDSRNTTVYCTLSYHDILYNKRCQNTSQAYERLPKDALRLKIQKKTCLGKLWNLKRISHTTIFCTKKKCHFAHTIFFKEGLVLNKFCFRW